MLKLLTRRDHSRVELTRKLAAKGYEPKVIEDALAFASEKAWVCEERFIESYIQMRKRRGYGPLRIREELRERGITESIFPNGFEEDAWDSNLASCFQKKFGCTKLSDDFATRAKQIRFLQYRGYTLEQINRVLSSRNNQSCEQTS